MAYTDIIEQAAATSHEHGFGDAGSKSPDERFADLKEAAAAYLPPEDVETIERAYHFAKDAHADQRRRSGEPYITHPIEVAIILTGLNMDVDTIAAALLHDTIEDTPVTREDVVEAFGEGVATLSATQRSCVSNMSPEYGSTCLLFPVDERTLDYFRMTGRSFSV